MDTKEKATPSAIEPRIVGVDMASGHDFSACSCGKALALMSGPCGREGCPLDRVDSTTTGERRG